MTTYYLGLYILHYYFMVSAIPIDSPSCVSSSQPDLHSAKQVHWIYTIILWPGKTNKAKFSGDTILSLVLKIFHNCVDIVPVLKIIFHNWVDIVPFVEDIPQLCLYCPCVEDIPQLSWYCPHDIPQWCWYCPPCCRYSTTVLCWRYSTPQLC